MKFESFSFHVTQLKYVSLAMTHIIAPVFRPDGKTPVQITTMLSDADAAMAAFMDKFDELNVARGQLDGARLAAHNAAVDVYACMKSCYRNNRGELASIRRLPKEDRTAVQTLTRVKGLSRRWASLPPPFPGGTFQVGTVTLAIFDGLLADLELKISTYNDCSAQFQAQQIALRDMDGDITSFVTAALAQGRASYAEGTMDRAYIDAIPVEPSTLLPAQSVIDVATSPESGAVRLEFSALHATSFAVWHKGPGEAVFTQVGESLLPGVYEAAGLVAGEHLYEVVGRNSRGDGPASAPSTVPVAGALPEQPWVSGESQAEGSVHLWYGAAGATSFQVWHKGPGESQFTQVDTTLTGEYAVFGLVGGMHAYKAVGVNAAGVGPASEPLAIDVEAVAVA